MILSQVDGIGGGRRVAWVCQCHLKENTFLCKWQVMEHFREKVLLLYQADRQGSLFYTENGCALTDLSTH